MIDLGKVKPGSIIRIPFSSFDKDDGSSITMTNFAAADILIYKDGSTTERASTSGFTATTDFDGKTGKHLAIIDLADNTTAGFFSSGSEYLVAIDAVTVDAVTTGGWIARFKIGYPDSILDTTLATVSSQTNMTLTDGPGDDNALTGWTAVFHDIASAVQIGSSVVSAYTGSTKTITLTAGPQFTVAAADNVHFYPPVNVRWIGSALQTGRDIGASVLLSSGTGTGQLDFTSGVVKANLAQILGTALTETAGLIAAGFKQFFNIASPTSTMNTITTVTTATNVTNDVGITQAGADKVWSSTTRTLSAFSTALAVSVWDVLSASVATASSIGLAIKTNLDVVLSTRLGTPSGASLSADLLSLLNRLTSARAGYLDNLNIGGNVASSAEVVAIQNNTSSVFTVPQFIERPDSGTTPREVHLYLYDGFGNMEAPDSAPTLTLTNQAGTDRSSRLDSTTMALVGTGHYKVIYTASVGDTLEQLLWEVTIVEGGVTRLRGGNSEIVDTTNVAFTSTDRTNLGSIKAVTDVLPNAGALTSLAQDSTVAKASAIAALNNISTAQVLAQVDAALDAANAEEAAVPAANASLRKKINYMFAWRRNKKTQTSTTMTLRNDADSGNIATSAISDDGTTLTLAEDA